MLLARDLLDVLGLLFSLWWASRCAMARSGELGSGMRFQVNFREYSPTSGGEKETLVRCGIGVSTSTFIRPEGPLTSADKTPDWKEKVFLSKF